MSLFGKSGALYRNKVSVKTVLNENPHRVWRPAGNSNENPHRVWRPAGNSNENPHRVWRPAGNHDNRIVEAQSRRSREPISNTASRLGDESPLAGMLPSSLTCTMDRNPEFPLYNQTNVQGKYERFVSWKRSAVWSPTRTQESGWSAVQLGGGHWRVVQ